MIKPKYPAVSVGSRVSFESEYGHQTGEVIDFIPCLLNGREHARIEIDHALRGIVHRVPVDTLQPI